MLKQILFPAQGYPVELQILIHTLFEVVYGAWLQSIVPESIANLLYKQADESSPVMYTIN